MPSICESRAKLWLPEALGLAALTTQLTLTLTHLELNLDSL